jgi:hypothetical protein
MVNGNAGIGHEGIGESVKDNGWKWLRLSSAELPLWLMHTPTVDFGLTDVEEVCATVGEVLTVMNRGVTTMVQAYPSYHFQACGCGGRKGGCRGSFRDYEVSMYTREVTLCGFPKRMSIAYFPSDFPETNLRKNIFRKQNQKSALHVPNDFGLHLLSEI